MQLYNVEFFTKEFEYVGSQQIQEPRIEYDYLSPDESSIVFELSTRCNIDNIICIRSLKNENIYTGIVTTINETSKGKNVKFKPLLNLFNIPVVVGEIDFIEKWIENKIAESYINNADVFQNISALRVDTRTQTEGSIDTEEVIVNLLDIIGYVLKKFNIVVNFEIDLKNKKIITIIEKNTEDEKVIEADLPNVFSKTIEVKTEATENSINKITIINTSEDNEIATYYRENDGNITQVPEPSKRIVPVIFSIKAIQVKSEEFEQKALETATADLAEDNYNNFIELKVSDTDTLINPMDFKIGQKVIIISNGVQYTSYYTGYSTDRNNITMFFGAIRLELTKKLKRRLFK